MNKLLKAIDRFTSNPDVESALKYTTIAVWMAGSGALFAFWLVDIALLKLALHGEITMSPKFQQGMEEMAVEGGITALIFFVAGIMVHARDVIAWNDRCSASLKKHDIKEEHASASGEATAQ